MNHGRDCCNVSCGRCNGGGRRSDTWRGLNDDWCGLGYCRFGMGYCRCVMGSTRNHRDHEWRITSQLTSQAFHRYFCRSMIIGGSMWLPVMPIQLGRG